jgi:hypothetical protein
VVRAADGRALLRVQVKPPSAVPLRLARWSLRAGKGSDGEWLGLPPAATDAQGRAELSFEPGTYFVAATQVSTTVDLSTVADVELELQQGAPLTGRVLEAGSERSISGALVMLSPGHDAPDSERQMAQTDGLGRFAFDAVPKTELQLEVSAAGWAAGHATARAPDPVDIRLEPSCRVDGVVVDGEGASVGGVRDGDPATLAGPGGRFWLELECGLGHTLIARDADGRVGVAKLEPNQRSVTVRLERGLNVPGTVRRPDGQPVAGAELAAMLGDDEVRARTVTDERGAFTLSGLSPGSYVVRARKGRGTTGTVYGFEVPSEQPLEVVIEPGAALEGEVIGGDDPISVEVSWPTLRGERPARTQTLGGRFRFDDLPVGTALIKAAVPGRSSDRRLFLSAGQTQAVQLTLEGHGRLVGRVTGPDAARAWVVAFRPDREHELSRSVRVSPDGTYVLEIPAGTVSVAASFDGRMVRRFEENVQVKAGEDTHVDLNLDRVDAGQGWGPMASVMRGEVGASFENVNGGVQVSWVVADSPMSAAGVKVGDLLTAIDGEPVSNALDAFARTRGAPGATMSITWLREGTSHTVKLTRAP